MKWNKLFGLLCLLVLVLPNAFILNPPGTLGIESRFKDDIPVLNSASTIEETSKTTSTSIDASSEPLPPEEEPIEKQDPPSSLTGDGAPRAATLYWNDTRGFLDRDNVTDVQVPLEDGELYYEALNFTRIEAFGITLPIEEDYYWYYSNMYANEPLFMSFRIEGTTPVRVDGFWALFASTARGPLNYVIFNATFPMDPRASTEPHIPQGSKAYPVDFTLGSTQWVWFDLNETEMILDPLNTYLNTFYVAIWEDVDNAKLYWWGADDGLGPNGDNDDEGDAYMFFAPHTYLPEDFTLIVEILPLDRYPLPSQLAMTVNGTAVLDLGPPGNGFWFDWPFPYPYNPGGLRYYDVDWLWPDYYQWAVTFDAIWYGKYTKFALTNSSFVVWINQTVAQWTLNLTAQFPVQSSGRFILVSIEEDWNVTEVRHSIVSGSLGSIHHNWTEFSDYVMIDRARSGIWTLFCNAPNYMIHAEVLDILYQPVTDLYAPEIAIARGYIQNHLGENATDGLGWLLVFDPNGFLHTIFEEWIPMPPGGLTEHNWDTSSSYMGGVYTLLFFWANGTEVGLNASTLGVWHATQSLSVEVEYPEPGGELLRGEEAFVHFYYADIFDIGIGNAIITVINETSGLEYEGYAVVDYSGGGNPGWYTVYIFTDNATIGVQNNVTIHVVKDYYDEQTYFKQFTVRSRATHIVFLPGYGLENVTLPDNSTAWRTTPEPYINDTRLEFTIKYTDYNGIPIEGAQLEPLLIKNGNSTRLDWIDLYQEEEDKAGFYNITIDTNPVEGNVFHEGEFGVIIIKASKLGYESTWSHLPGEPGLIWVRPLPRPTWIDVPTEYQDIELYEDWLYPTPQHPNILRVVLRDTLSGEDLSHGTVILDVPGSGNVPLILATPGLGLYEIRALNTTGATPGTYDFTIRASATDFANSTTTVSITIHPKQEIVYDAIPDFRPAPNHGSSWSLSIQFRLGSVSPQFISTSKGEFISSFGKQQGSVYLPLGTKVTLEILQGAVSTQIEKFVEADGWVYFEGILDQEGEASFYLYIEGAENYAGFTQEAIICEGTPLRMMVQSFGSYFLSNPLFIIAAVCIIVIPLGAGLSYRRYVMLPKRRRKLAKYQAIADTFSDVANLNRLLVLQKESGICVFDPFAEESQDATLVAGFLQAISTFGHDLADSPGLANGEKEEATLRELTYEGFRILIHDGQFVRNALVLSGKPSDQLRERLENFTTAFEKRYRKDFENWDGRVDQFNGASDLVEEIFLISLRHPHSVAKRKPRNVQLTSLESDIYKLSKELTLDREYVFLGQILSTYLTAAKTDKREALMAIYQLRVKGVFRPIQLDPITQPDTSVA
ncbi:MAG: hypothetical protein ACXADB_05455 [Candidatus Hermodarchaeia archaeon]|jgi:hypothetical protein